ncbi:tripartite motif-containing protein 2-like [Saccostrea echinata]|uniref:tripartite motif-containing protein 2-like n=1 Tax=Saccostrea echinata TaxID=191078 RepID=UPI002A80B708|nr:tripartite motif-containing protein 2-like [Saccostrea echinata]
MASSSTWAQDVIACDLCDNPTQQFCNNCQVSLCGGCINKHVKRLKSETHDIVPYKDRRERLVFLSCDSHPNQKCEGHCQQCNVPVCFKCVTGPHSGHAVKDVAEIVQQMKEEIKKETEEIESFISRFTISGVNIDQKISNMTEKFKTMEKEGENLRKTWHQEVDNIFNTLQSTIRKMKDKRLTALRSHQSRLQDSGSKLALITKENKKILKSNKVFDVTNCKSEIGEFRNIPTDVDVMIPSLKMNTVQGKELSIELGEYKATLTQTSISSLSDDVSILSVRKLLDKAKVIASFPSGIKPLGSIICIGTNEAWARGVDIFIRRIDIHGSLKEKITTECDPYPADISVTRQGELMYSDANSRTVNIVRYGRIETLITLPRGWYPGGLCFTRSGDLLVSMCTDESHHKIVRYQGQTSTQEIDKDNHGQNIFKGGEHRVYVEENNNGDICASDVNAKKVIVVDKTGRVRFRYNGTPARRKKPFFPVYIVTDSLGQVIISDFNNDCLHILDQNGQFLRCVDNCGLLSPGGLGVDSEGRLWVGLHDSGDIKVIQYLK